MELNNWERMWRDIGILFFNLTRCVWISTEVYCSYRRQHFVCDQLKEFNVFPTRRQHILLRTTSRCYWSKLEFYTNRLFIESEWVWLDETARYSYTLFWDWVLLFSCCCFFLFPKMELVQSFIDKVSKIANST